MTRKEKAVPDFGGGPIIQWVLQIIFVVVVIVLLVWAFKEIAPFFTDSILLDDFARELT